MWSVCPGTQRSRFVSDIVWLADGISEHLLGIWLHSAGSQATTRSTGSWTNSSKSWGELLSMCFIMTSQASASWRFAFCYGADTQQLTPCCMRTWCSGTFELNSWSQVVTGEIDQEDVSVLSTGSHGIVLLDIMLPNLFGFPVDYFGGCAGGLICVEFILVFLEHEAIWQATEFHNITICMLSACVIRFEVWGYANVWATTQVSIYQRQVK